jgi:hypothetical protein
VPVETPDSPAPRFLNAAQLVPAVVFLAVAAVAVGYALNMQAEERRERAQGVAAKLERGLPESYPDDVVPLYEGAKVIAAETGSGESSDGAPMHKWVIKAEVVEDDRQKIFDFYKDYLLERGMSQSMLISIPSGYGVDYADEQRTVHLVIEKKKSDKHTQLEITLHELVD